MRFKIYGEDENGEEDSIIVSGDTLENAKRRAEYWKAEHAAANAEIETLRRQCRLNGGLDVATEREMCQDLFEECRQLLRYDGIDKDRVRQAVDRIRDIVDERLAALENDELDDD